MIKVNNSIIEINLKILILHILLQSKHHNNIGKLIKIMKAKLKYEIVKQEYTEIKRKSHQRIKLKY